MFTVLAWGFLLFTFGITFLLLWLGWADWENATLMRPPPRVS